ncbi:BLUF domain-containing protein [Psychrosphaera sp.]|nr:BLUF domain-containing protein [Psychrosphaera sp.]
MNNKQSLKQLAYISKAQEFIDEKALVDILEFAVDNNQKLEITGFLLFGEGCFVQVIEGPQGNIDDLYSKITLDNRHRDVVRTLYQDIDERLFEHWHMSFKRFELPRDKVVEGFSDYLESYFSDELDKHFNHKEGLAAGHQIAIDIIKMMRKSYVTRDK